MSRLVSNTSPLIVLARAGLLDLLPRLFSEVLIPAAVRAEILAGPDSDPMKQSFTRCSWLRIVELDPPLSPLAGMQLGNGEAEAIELARRQGEASLLLDDRAARRAAQLLGFKVIGSLGVLAVAGQRGLIGSFDEGVRRIRTAGLFVSEEVVAAVRRNLEGNN